MAADQIIIVVVLVVAFVLFVWEWVPYDVTALLVVASLMVFGVVTPEEGLAGFSNQATLTIGAMFVLSAGLRQTGALDRAGAFFLAVARQRSPETATALLLVIVGVVSAFINNTAAVAIFIPVVLGVAAELGISPSRLLMPLSFASMFGGVCTLIGTSTNILVSTVAQDSGLDAFSMFEFAPMGLAFSVVGLAYLLLFGKRLVPARREAGDLSASFELDAYLTEIELDEAFPDRGRPLSKSSLCQSLELDVAQVMDCEGRQKVKAGDCILETGDVLRVRAAAPEIQHLLGMPGLRLRPAHRWIDADFEKEDHVLVEAVIAPDASFEGKRLTEVPLDDRFGAIVMALRHRGGLKRKRLDSVRLSGGDSLLLWLPPDRVKELDRGSDFVLVSRVSVLDDRTRRMPIALLTLVAVVLLAALGVVPIVVSAIAGCVILLLTGCLSSEEAIEAINWKVIFLLAGVIPLGTAMENSGVANLVTDGIVGGLGGWGNTAILSGFFLLSMALTNFISNQATAALLAPLAIQTAHTMEVSAYPFLMAVTFAASLSFLSPIGYQTNTLVYGPGQYRFTDFTRVGAPLNLIFWIMGTFLIPVFWPFE